MRNFWKDKVVLITGSTRGIGLELAKQLLRKDAVVIFHSYKSNLQEELVINQALIDNRALFVRADVRSVAEVNQMIELVLKKFSHLDVLINNAGISSVGSIEEISDYTMRSVIDTNLYGPLLVTRASIPALKNSKGSICMISSLAAHYGIPNYITYSIAKSALIPLQQGLSIELNKFGINVSAIILGFTENDKQKYALNASGEEVLIPIRNKTIQISQTNAARKIIKTIQNKKRISYTGFSGIIYSVMVQLTPSLVRIIQQRTFEKKNLINSND